MKYFPFLILVVYLAKSFFLAPSLFDFGVILAMSGLFFSEMRYQYLVQLKDKEFGEKAKELETVMLKKVADIEDAHNRRVKVFEDKIAGLNLVMAKNNISQTSVNDKAKVAWF